MKCARTPAATRPDSAPGDALVKMADRAEQFGCSPDLVLWMRQQVASAPTELLAERDALLARNAVLADAAEWVRVCTNCPSCKGKLTTALKGETK